MGMGAMHELEINETYFHVLIILICQLEVVLALGVALLLIFYSQTVYTVIHSPIVPELAPC